MDLNGECSLLAVYFRLSCPHKPLFNACSKYFPLINEKHKSGCPEVVAPFKAASQRQQIPADLVAPFPSNKKQRLYFHLEIKDAVQNHPEPEVYHKKVPPIYAFFICVHWSEILYAL